MAFLRHNSRADSRPRKPALSERSESNGSNRAKLDGPIHKVLCRDSRPRLSGRARLDNGGSLRSITRLIAFVAIALLPGCRLDMHVQPRQNPYAKSNFFPDQRSERPLVEGTVARGQLHADTYFYTGKIGDAPGDYMPFPVTKEVLDRGRERFDIFCAPCHSRVGDGNGIVPSRGFSRKPPSYHIPRLQKAPLGYFFDVITNGYGIMQDYSAQVPPEDRWKIVAYIRALQLSQNATQSDVPAGQTVPSTPPNFGSPGSGATLPTVEPSSRTEEHK
jgi:mono/diheme cytochrome c family protein